MVVGQLRRALSVAAVRVQAECLVGRMDWVGEGAAAAAERRARARERFQLEREGAGWKLGEAAKRGSGLWGRAAFSLA